MAITEKLRSYLDSNHVTYRTLDHFPAYTAQRLAEMEHVPGREHAKAVVIRAGDRNVMAVLPAPRRVDFAKLRKLLRESAELLPEEQFGSVFPDCEPGAVPPFGNLYGMEVIADRSLQEDDEIIFPGGTHTDSIRMKYTDFERLAQPKVADIAS